MKVDQQGARQSRIHRMVEATREEPYRQKEVMVKATREDPYRQKELRAEVNRRLTRYGEAFTELASGKKSPCPRLVIIEQVLQKRGCSPFLPKKYNLFFVCEHSMEKVEPPLTFSISRKWIRDVAPFVFMSLRILPLALGIPIPTQLFESIFSGLLGFVDPQFMSAINGMINDGNGFSMGGGNEGGMMGILPIATHRDAIARGQLWDDSARALTSTPNNAMSREHLEMVDSSYKALTEFAKQEENLKLWKPKMSLVMNEHGHFIWVIKNYACLYDDKDTSEPQNGQKSNVQES